MLVFLCASALCLLTWWPHFIDDDLVGLPFSGFTVGIDPTLAGSQLFGLPQSFSVDREQLDSRYRELQRATHPDRYVNASDQERRISMQQAARVSQRTAYFHLGDLIEVGSTEKIFTRPNHQLTEDYITGRFG